MNFADFAIIGIIVISTLIAIIRGFVKEAISLTTWILAVVISSLLSAKLAVLLPDSIQIPSLRIAISMAILFVCTLLVGGLANFLISTLVSHSGLSGTDRALGVVFGAVRGVLIVAVLILIGGLMQLSQDGWWQESLLLGYFETVAVWLKALLPDDVAEYFVFVSSK